MAQNVADARNQSEWLPEVVDRFKPIRARPWRRGRDFASYKKGMLPCQTLQFHYGEEREVDVSCFFTFCCPSEQNKRVAPRTLIVVVLCHFRGAHRMLDFNRMLFLIFHSPDSYILCHKDMKIIIWVRFEGRWTFPAGRFRTAPVIGENVLCCKGVNWY